MSKAKVYIPLIASIAVIIGFLLGVNLSQNSGYKDTPLMLRAPGKSGNFNILNEIIGYIDSEYVDDVEKEKLIDKTVQYLLQELDPHSYYISAQELEAMNEPLEGNFEGIGVQFNIQKDTIVIVTPLQGGPSEKVGIQAGDRIIEVEEEPVAGTGITNRDVLKLLKGDKGSKVNVKIKRNNETHDFTITRDEIPIHSVDVAYMINKETGYVKILRFAKNTYSEFNKAVKQLKEAGMENLIIDLRGNGGGFLDAAVKISDEILSEGETIVYTEGRSRPRETYRAKSQARLKTENIAVLIDESSASASEILSGAIQDNDRGIIVGRRSFGKGLVQEQTMWPDGSATRLTVARYYTPTGRSIQRPYREGTEKYHQEIMERFKNDEMLHPDSTNFPDSLKYSTPGGRTVYGGGGIFPDVFVPLDTTQSSNYLNRLIYGGILYQWAFDYADKHRDHLTGKFNPESFKDKFEITEELSDFIKYAEEQGVEYNEKGFERTQSKIALRLKAYIARNVWNSEGFYPVWNEKDNVILKTLEVLENKAELQAAINPTQQKLQTPGNQ